jgi:DNA modification methylase
VLPHLGSFDLLLTDPPYGIGESSKKAASRGRIHGGNVPLLKDYGDFDWDKEPVEEWVMSLARSICRWQIIFGGNYYQLPPSSCWLIWDKENSGDFADGEMAWTNLKKAMRIKRHLWNGMIRKGQEERFHPTQKPLEVMAWTLQHAPEDVVSVLDPWMGSGTTLRACKDAGKTCVGIERDERYCEIAAKRMAQEVFAF